MTTLFATLLTAHVLTGLLGVILSFVTTFLLLKTAPPRVGLLIGSYGAFIAYVTSWLSGGWYYWKYYGNNVKPVIIGGDYTWAHLIFMEAKEHAFLFLPIVTFVLAVIIHVSHNELLADRLWKRRVSAFSVAITALAILITLSGVLITGGAR